MLQENLMFAQIGICSILMIFSFLTDSMSKRRKFSLFFMALSAIMLLVSDKLADDFNGIVSTIGILITHISKFFEYGLFLVIIYIFGQYLKDLFIVEGKVENIPKRLKIANFIIFAAILILILSQPTGLYYSFDNMNVYHRSKLNVLSYLFPLIALLIQLSVIINYHRKLRKSLLLPLLLFTIMPLITSVLHFIIPEIYLTGIAIVAMIVLLYCFSIIDNNNLLKIAHKKEVDFLLDKQQNIQLMINQTTYALVEAIDAKDKYTHGHSRRVADYSVMIAKKLGKTVEECEEIRLIALLHDVGKIGIADAIINKTGKLTDEEFGVIKTHPKIGGEILSKIKISPNLKIGARWHHERYDGKGYPDKLKGEKIPEIARIIAEADSYDAMASKRSYRDALPQAKIRSELENGIGTQFDPDFAKIMIDIIDEDINYTLREN